MNINEMSDDKKDVDPRWVTEALFSFVQDLASNPESGASARIVLSEIATMTNIDYGIMHCVHCLRHDKALRIRHDGGAVCLEARDCFRQMQEEIADGVMLSIRQYQRTTIISYFEYKKLPTGIDKYMMMGRPTIHSRIENYKLSEEIIEKIKAEIKLAIEAGMVTE